MGRGGHRSPGGRQGLDNAELMGHTQDFGLNSKSNGKQRFLSREDTTTRYVFSQDHCRNGHIAELWVFRPVS